MLEPRVISVAIHHNWFMQQKKLFFIRLKILHTHSQIHTDTLIPAHTDTHTHTLSLGGALISGCNSRRGWGVVNKCSWFRWRAWYPFLVLLAALRTLSLLQEARWSACTNKSIASLNIETEMDEVREGRGCG